MILLTATNIGATQLGWYLHDKQTGFDYGMIAGTFIGNISRLFNV